MRQSTASMINRAKFTLPKSVTLFAYLERLIKKKHVIAIGFYKQYEPCPDLCPTDETTQRNSTIFSVEAPWLPLLAVRRPQHVEVVLFEEEVRGEPAASAEVTVAVACCNLQAGPCA